jgi:dihydroorotase
MKFMGYTASDTLALGRALESFGEDGKIEAIGKKVNKNNIPSREKFVDLKEKHVFPGIVDMRVFVGEPGFEYKENFKTLSNAALAGGVTSVVTMPNTSPVIDNVSIVDFLKRRGRDKATCRNHQDSMRPEILIF